MKRILVLILLTTYPISHISSKEENSVSDVTEIRKDQNRLNSEKIKRKSIVKLAGESIKVRKNEDIDEVVVLGGNIYIEGAVNHAVAILGNIYVKGTVKNDIAVIMGNLYLYEGAKVKGDIAVIGGKIVNKEKIPIAGDVVEIQFFSCQSWVCKSFILKPLLGGVYPSYSNDKYKEETLYALETERLERVEDLFKSFMFPTIVLLIGIFLFLILPEPAKKVLEILKRDNLQSTAIGFMVMLLFIPVITILVVTLIISIIGCPLLLTIPVIVVIYATSLLIGYSLSLSYLGERIFPSLEGKHILALVLGIVIVHGINIISHLLYLSSYTILETLSWVLWLVYVSVVIFLSAMGSGALFSGLRRR